MIYTNTRLVVQERVLSFGTLKGISIGEQGRGRKELFIPCPDGIEYIDGVAPNLSIGRTKSGKCRIDKGNTGFFAILSSEGGYTRRGCGRIWSLKSNPIKVLDTANGADGAAGRIGSWSAIIAEMPQVETFIRIRKSGGNPSDLVYFDGYNFVFISNEEIELFFDEKGLDMPFSLDGERNFNSVEWV